ncbi:MAG: hypothetical protein ABI947_19315 [Chloroflexota bacterium]
MNAETETFIRDLFTGCSTEPVFLTLTAIHPDGDKPTPSRHVRLGDTVALEQALSGLHKANDLGWGAYIGIAPRHQDLGRWSRGRKSNLACLPALFVDIDQPDNALIRLGWFDLPASCILHSGRGYHAYWFLDPPTTDFIQADKLLHGLAQRLNGDAALSVAQSMRLPGTINTKLGRAHAVCHFVGYHPERRYDLTEFKPFLPKVLSYTNRRHTWETQERNTAKLSPLALDTLTDAVLYQLEGRWRSNGFIGALCPLPHLRDRPGMHFSYHAETGWGHCFGKHGKISPMDLEELLGVSVQHHSSVGAA